MCTAGNFEESVLNGRLEPVSTVEGFTAEIGTESLIKTSLKASDIEGSLGKGIFRAELIAK